MDISNKQPVLACLLTAVLCAATLAEERCGRFDKEPGPCGNDCMALLDGEFKSLLHSASGGERPPICEAATQCASKPPQESLEPVSRVRLASHNYVPEETPATRHLLPRLANKPTTLPKPVTKTCVLKDETTAERVLTLKIPGSVKAETISPEELAAREAAESSLKRLPTNKTTNPAPYVAPTGPQPILRIGSGSTQGSIKVDAHNVDVRELLQVISNESDIAIWANPRLEGTISSTTQAESVVVLIRTMLEPFSYSVVQTEQAMIVCGPNESPEQVVAACLATIEPEPQQVAVAEASPKVDPQPQTLPKNESAAEIAPQNAIKLASAEVPTQKIKKPLRRSKPQLSREAAAVDRIVRVAQDAFATDQPEYALQVLAQGMKRFPKSFALSTMLGEMHYLQGNYDQATVALAKAISQQKQNAMANELMGRSLAALGQKQRAKHYLLQAQECRKANR